MKLYTVTYQRAGESYVGKAEYQTAEAAERLQRELNKQGAWVTVAPQLSYKETAAYEYLLASVKQFLDALDSNECTIDYQTHYVSVLRQHVGELAKMLPLQAREIALRNDVKSFFDGLDRDMFTLTFNYGTCVLDLMREAVAPKLAEAA